MTTPRTPNMPQPTMPQPFWIKTEDWHTAGEPFRIVDELPQGYLPEASTVAQRRLNVISQPGHPLDTLRQSLCHEPRGHADMYGGFITPPNDAGAAFGVLFWHKDGFSTACGHGTIALGYWAIQRGLVQAPKNGEVAVAIDVPSGRVVANMAMAQGKPVHADFINVASYQLTKALAVTIPSSQVQVSVDLAFGGAVYACVDAHKLGLKVEPRNVDEFIKLGREIKAALGERAHYGIYDCYGVIFFEEEGDDTTAATVRQRNVTVFADGQIDRSPCGSGTCARLAILKAQGRLEAEGARLQHRSIIGSSFRAGIVSGAESPVEGFPGVIPRVQGEARLYGRMEFLIDPAEEIYPGFLLR